MPAAYDRVVAGRRCLGHGAGPVQVEIYHLTDAERQELTAGRDELAVAIAGLKAKLPAAGGPAARIADAEIYLDAVDRNLRLGQFFGDRQVKQARACLAEGRSRVASIAKGETPWLQKAGGGAVVLGHRSEVDGTAQPFQVYVPDQSFRGTARRRHRSTSSSTAAAGT